MPALNNPSVIYLVEERENPSTDYFILPAILVSGCRVVRCVFSDRPKQSDLIGACVIFVRYLPSAWTKLIERVRPDLHSLVFFMDDDVLDTKASAGLPMRYRYKLARLGAGQAAWLKKQKADLWVSNNYLQKKYSGWRPRLLQPFPLVESRDGCRVFYHGSASHDAEIKWLHPVIEEALHRDERISFEIIGGQDVNRLYKGIPRVNVIHPMSWSAYRSFQSLHGRHIGLAPLLDTEFNKARSYTKYMDITSCGAVGIYSPNSVYTQVVQDRRNGLIIPLRKAKWVEAILELARDESLRKTLLQNAEINSAELAQKAQRGYSGLLKSGPK